MSRWDLIITVALWLALGLGVFFVPGSMWLFVLFFLALGSSTYSLIKGGKEIAQMVGVMLFCVLQVGGAVYSLPPIMRWVGLGVAVCWTLYAIGKWKGTRIGRREALVPGVWVEIKRPMACKRYEGGGKAVSYTLFAGIEAVIYRKSGDFFWLWIPERYASQYGWTTPHIAYEVSDVGGLRFRTEEWVGQEIVASVRKAMENWTRLRQGLPASP